MVTWLKANVVKSLLLRSFSASIAASSVSKNSRVKVISLMTPPRPSTWILEWSGRLSFDSRASSILIFVAVVASS